MLVICTDDDMSRGGRREGPSPFCTFSLWIQNSLLYKLGDCWGLKQTNIYTNNGYVEHSVPKAKLIHSPSAYIHSSPLELDGRRKKNKAEKLY